jgi:hypothetical protein
MAVRRAETVTHFQMAGSYSKQSPVAVKFGPLFTRAKWVSASLPLLAGWAMHHTPNGLEPDAVLAARG